MSQNIMWPPRGGPIVGPRLPYPQRDPITIGAAIVTALSQATGVILAAEAFFAASAIIGTVAVGGLLAGAQYALGKTMSDKGGGFAQSNVAGINAPEVRGNVRQSAPMERIVYGRTRIGGAVSFLDTETPPNLYLQLLLSARRISAFRSLRIADNEITFLSTAIENNTILTPFPTPGQVYVKNGNSRLFACFRDGDPAQAIDALLDADFDLDPNFLQSGIATASFLFKYGDNRSDFEEMWGQVAIPSPQIEVDGATVYDPRDASQLEDDEETWQFSRNAALIQADWLRQPYGVNFPSGRIDWHKVGMAADFDDEIIVNEDGTAVRRHVLDGVVQLSQRPRDVMEAMLTANRGFVVQSQGRGWVQSSTPQDPIITINAGMLVGGFEFRDDKPKRETFNKITSRFSSSDREYQDIDGPVLERADLIAEDEETLEGTVRVPFTSDHRAVQRLQKQFLEESRLPRAMTCRISVKNLARSETLEIGKCIRFEDDAYPRMNCVYMIEEMGFSDDFGLISLSLVEYDKTISIDWIASEDEQPFELPEVVS